MTSDPALSGALRVGAIPGVTTATWQRRWADRRLGPLQVVRLPGDVGRRPLDEGLVDLCFVRDDAEAPQISREGIHLVRLWEEQPVVLAAKDHPIAVFDEIDLADLAEEEQFDPWHPDAADLAAGGAGVVVLPQAVAREWSRRDLALCLLTGTTPTVVSLALPTDEHPLAQDFIGVVRGRTQNSTRGSAPAPSAADRRSTRRKKRRG